MIWHSLVERKYLLHALNKLCISSWVTWSWFLKGAAAVEYLMYFLALWAPQAERHVVTLLSLSRDSRPQRPVSPKFGHSQPNKRDGYVALQARKTFRGVNRSFKTMKNQMRPNSSSVKWTSPVIISDRGRLLFTIRLDLINAWICSTCIYNAEWVNWRLEACSAWISALCPNKHF